MAKWTRPVGPEGPCYASGSCNTPEEARTNNGNDDATKFLKLLMKLEF